MNGATAELLASTRRTATSSVITKIGTSQYFLRTRRNWKNSRKKESTEYPRSELPHHRIGGRAGRVAAQPIGIGVGLRPQSQEIFSKKPQQQTGGSKCQEENQRHGDRTYDVVQQNRQLAPKHVERIQHAG